VPLPRGPSAFAHGVFVRRLLPLLLTLILACAVGSAADSKAPNLQLSVSQRSFFAGKPALLSLSLYNLKQARVAVYAVTMETLAPNAGAVASDDRTNKNSLQYRLGHLNLKTLAPVKQWTASVPKLERDYWNELDVKVPLLPAGVYVVSATGGGVQKRTWFAVSSRALLAKRSPGEVLAWVANGASGQPVAGLPVALFGEKGKLATAVTTGDGLVKFVAPPLTTPCWIATQSGDPAFALATSPSTEDPYRAYLYTDRPIYRPGQTVRFRGTVRASEGPKYSPPQPRTQTRPAQTQTPRGGRPPGHKILDGEGGGGRAGEFLGWILRRPPQPPPFNEPKTPPHGEPEKTATI